MWRLLYTTEQAKKVEVLLSAMNTGDYSRCNNIVYGNIISTLRKAEKGTVGYMELEDSKETRKIIKNMQLKSLPALVHIEGKKSDEITQVFYEVDILVSSVERFVLPDL